MRVRVDLGGGHDHRRKEKRVPRNRRHYASRGVVGYNKTVSSPLGVFSFGLLFVAFTALVFFLLLNNVNKTKDYIETTGRVIDYVDHYSSSNDQYMYSEIVEYTVDGKVYEVTSSSSSTVPLPPGSRVKVYYNPVNPGVAVVNQKSTHIIGYVICGIMGVAGLCVMFIGAKGLITGKSSV